MRVLRVLVLFLLLTVSVNCWARRRRAPDARVERSASRRSGAEEVTKRAELGAEGVEKRAELGPEGVAKRAELGPEVVAKRAGAKLELPEVNTVKIAREGTVKVSLQPCDCDHEACGFTVQCSCCNKPSFYGCGDTGLLGSPSLKLLTLQKRSINTDLLEQDEAGCHLRSVLYNDQAICIPGNMASMLLVAHQTSDGDCYPVYPLNCQTALDDSTAYYQHIYVPEGAVMSTLAALGAAGHKCSRRRGLKSGIMCAI